MTTPRGWILSIGDQHPRVAEDVFVAPGGVVAGDVEIGPGSSVWFNAVLRGDVAPIRVGAGTNIQDNAVIHVDAGRACVIGDNVTVGHGAIVHASVVGDGVTIGMGAVVLSRCEIGPGAVVAAGAVVPEGTVVPAGALVMGMPAREKRAVDPAEDERFTAATVRYIENAQRFRAELAPEQEGSGDGR